MRKLNIEYRTEEQDEKNYFKGNTYFSFTMGEKTTLISIEPNETRKLGELVKIVENNLQNGFHLQKDEKFEISWFDQFVMEFEELNNVRLNSAVYNIVKRGYQAVQDGKTTYEELLEELK